MDNRIKQITVPFLVMMIVNLGTYFIFSNNFAQGLSPHEGLVPIMGLLFGPYGAIGVVIGNTICDLIRGYTPQMTFASEIISLGVALLAYKLWYHDFKYNKNISQPKLNNTFNVILFLGIVLLTSVLYSMFHKKIMYFFYPETISINLLMGLRFFINFLNSSFIFGIIGIWVSKYIGFIHLPKKSNKKNHEKAYWILLIILVISLVVIAIADYYFSSNPLLWVIESIFLAILLFVYALKPIVVEVNDLSSHFSPEKIMNIFLLETLAIVLLGIIISSDRTLVNAMTSLLPLNDVEVTISIFILMDLILIIFFIPSLFVLRYVEKKVVNPIVSFSAIEQFIKKGDKIESDGLIDVYSRYLEDETEIGNLARSYTNLIDYANEYIEDIKSIESEKKRIETELEIAERIQQANLPEKSIENRTYYVNGFSKPAKEVGGDFYDYYPIDDENVAVIIGDASGKGVPAAIVAIITQSIIKQLFKTEKDPSKILFSLNNQLCENNPELMFITLWIGVYNKNTGVLTYSNAGHERPLISKNGNIEFLEMDSGIVLGVMEDFDFKKGSIDVFDGVLLYTDGITDEKNINDEFYGSKRLMEFFKDKKFDEKTIKELINDIEIFMDGEDKFDDMTVLVVNNYINKKE